MKRSTSILTIMVIALCMVFTVSACNKKTVADNPNETGSSLTQDNLLDAQNVDFVKEAILDPSILQSELTESPSSTLDPLDTLINDLGGSSNINASPTDSIVIGKVVDISKIESAELREDGTADIVVYAPDMSAILSSLLDNHYSASISSADLEAYLLNAIKDESNFKRFNANVATIVVDGKLLLDTADEELKNAMTGGFRDAFTEFYYMYLEELFTALQNNN